MITLPQCADSTVVATLLVPISSSFTSFKTLSWIGSAYLIGQSVTQPLSGRLTDIFGRREGLLLCNVAFGVGTLLCGIATKEWILILGRAIAGLGGGAIVSISMFVAGDLVPLRKRGVVQGLLNIFQGVGSGLGGLLGGWLDSYWGWRNAFLVQVPFLVLGGIMVHFAVRIPNKTSEKSGLQRIDYLGSLTLTFALVLFLVAVNAGGNILPWSHPLVSTFLLSSAAFLACFVYVEEKISTEPIMPIRLLFDRTVAAACLNYWFTFMSYYGITYFMPVYLQLMGNTPTQAGLRFIPSSFGTGIGAFSAGIILRATGEYVYLSAATHILMIIGTGLMAFMQLDSEPWHPFVYLILFGLGFGGALVTTMMALVSTVEQDDQAVITAAGFAFRSTGSAIGLTVASTIFQNLLRLYLRRSIGDIEEADSMIDRIRANFGEIARLDDTILGDVRQSYMAALQGVFLTICGMNILAATCSLFMRQNKLYTTLTRQ